MLGSDLSVQFFVMLRRNRGMGGAPSVFSLLVLAIVFSERRRALLSLSSGSAPQWPAYLQLQTYYDFVRCTACWRSPPWRCGVKPRSTASRNWADEWTTCGAKARQRLDLDHLTGLLNQAALTRRVERQPKRSTAWWRSATWTTSRTSTTVTGTWWATRSCATSATCCGFHPP